MKDGKNYFTRMGDGSGAYMTEEEIRNDMKEGTQDAASRGKIPELPEDDWSTCTGSLPRKEMSSA
jgi:hypothetical protein